MGLWYSIVEEENKIPKKKRGGIVMRKIEQVKEKAKNLLNVSLNLAEMGYIDEALTIFDAVKCNADLGAYAGSVTYYF